MAGGPTPGSDRQRLLGESPQVSDEENWPEAVLTDEAEWKAIVESLFETGKQPAAVIAVFPAERLDEGRSGLDDTWYGLVLGEIQHVLYHAGQIPILRKAAGA